MFDTVLRWRSAAVAIIVATGALAATSTASAATWYVRSGAGSRGRGSATHPFGSLQQVEAAARPGDMIVVEPAPLDAPPLDGGIALKRRQMLIGGGPPVAGDTARLKRLPVITNTNATRLDGDAVRLANDARVENLVITGAYRGGVYGSNVNGVLVKDNDLSATNRSCSTGFVVQPFELPTTAPGVGIPFSSGLPNGWAAIMIDESRSLARVSVNDNVVHDAACADGIDIRAARTAEVSARVLNNTLYRLQQGSSQQSVLAIGMQSTGTARLDAHVDGNSETYIGSATVGDFGEADSEGLFANSAGRSTLTEHADRNTFAHGLGHISANCVEVVSSNGGPRMSFTLTNSTCNYVVGDVLEADNLSENADLTFNVEHVIAANSTFAVGSAQAQVEPGDDGDCMLEVASGAASRTSVTVDHSELSDCTADGLGVVSNVVDGTGPADELSFEVENSRITENQASNLRVENATPINRLDGRIEHTDLSESPGSPVILRNLETSGSTKAILDLGGGGLGSHGHNCILGGEPTDVSTVRYDLAAERDWWGAPGGPGPGGAVAVDGTIDSRSPLAGADCGPSSGSVIGPQPPARTQAQTEAHAPRRGGHRRDEPRRRDR